MPTPNPDRIASAAFENNSTLTTFHAARQREPRAAAVLAIAFGTTVAMWTVGYLGRLPIIMAPTWLVGFGMILCLVAGGFVAARDRALHWRGLLLAGAICATLNLLILGSLLAESDQAMRAAMLWLPAFFIATMVLMQLGALPGRRFARRPPFGPINWSARFAWTAVIATGLLLAAGGLVTGADAGLSVPDWPGTFGENMFLYPLSQMSGAIYYEHAHRLYGALVGITTIALAIFIWTCDRRSRLKWLLLVAVIAVIAQGVMGGIRVTAAEVGAEGIPIAGPEHETTLSVILRVLHGIFGQIFFALMTFIALMMMRVWRVAAAPLRHLAAATDRQLSLALLASLILQLVLGAMLRHTGDWLLLHITFAVIVALLAYPAAVRAWVFYDKVTPAFRIVGVLLLALISLQLLLGIAAYVVVGLDERTTEPTVWKVTLTTAHQMIGACILATATILAGLTHRRLAVAR